MKTKLLFKNALIATLFLSFALSVNAQKNGSGKINITSFEVVKAQNKVMIEWSTDKASKTNYFEVEKSTDGKNFKTVAYVLGADPTKSGCECFGCFDKVAGKAKESFYRLKHVDMNGNIQLSEVKMLALK